MAESIRTKAEIEADIEAARERLAEGVANLVNQVHPKAVAHRAVDDVRHRTSAGFRALRDQLVKPDGSLNLSRVALLGGAVVGAVTFIGVVRSISRR
jgi:hypothetical protein